MTEKSSNVPLWLTLGFAAGCAVGWVLFHAAAPSTPVPVPTVPPASENPTVETAKDTATLAATERHFQKWGGYAIWENNFTQFAVWNERRQRHGDFYEVHRTRGQFYFRTLPQLTWVLLDHGPRAPAPIWFAETVKMRAQFYLDHPNYDPSKEPAIKRPPLPPIAVASQDPVVRPSSTPRPVPGLPRLGPPLAKAAEQDGEFVWPQQPRWSGLPQPPPAPRGPIVLTPGAGGAR